MKGFISVLCLILSYGTATAQTNDSIIIRNIFSEALTGSQCYSWLDHLSNNIGGRLSGSKEATQAIDYVEQELKDLHVGNVIKQDVMVPHWVRGEKEYAEIITDKGNPAVVKICALGGSISTPKEGIKGKVIEINNFEELDKAGREKINGKIVFLNYPMNPANYNTFQSYGAAGKYRYTGAARAAKYGAIGVIVRSLTLALDDHPHTGAMAYADTVPKIPACAISTKGAELLSETIKQNADVSFKYILNCRILPDALSYNVIAEIKGSMYPDEIIVAGGHLDSWDTGDGAHDDGAGVVQCMEMINIFKKLNIKPKRTIRCVLFMNEENGLKGGEKYAALAKENKEKNIAAIETDAGGFTPRGFSLKGDSLQGENIMQWKTLFSQYGLHEWTRGYAGADIDHLKDHGTFLIGLSVDSQRYFDYHHAETDTFDKINKRELELGAASITSLVYLLSEYGMK